MQMAWPRAHQTPREASASVNQQSLQRRVWRGHSAPLRSPSLPPYRASVLQGAPELYPENLRQSAPGSDYLTAPIRHSSSLSAGSAARSEEHTSELQSRGHL